MIKYLTPFITAFILTVFLIIPAIWFSRKIKWENRKSGRHIHRKNISRVGGLVMGLVFNAVIFVNRDLYLSGEIYGFVLANIIVLIVGLWDDIREVFWKIQFFSQIAVAVLIFVIGIRIYYITNPLTGGIINLDSGLGVIFSAILVIIWIVMVMNAVNWADGIDGLSSGIALITAGAIFFLSLRPEVNQPAIAIISSILAGTIMGFLIFNFYPSKILAGTSGSMFMGFSLAVLAIFSGTKIATALLVLVIPIIDFLWVIGERIRNHKSIFKPDKNHLHYKLMELGWSQRKIVISYWAITAVIAIIALKTRYVGKSITLIVTATVMISALIFINKKISAVHEAEK